LSEKSKAFYVACESHTSNLLLGDAAKDFVTAFNFLNLTKSKFKTTNPLEQQVTISECFISLTLWYDLLTKMNVVSKTLQISTIHTDVVTVHLKEVLLQYF
jgi:hypothetical protein